MRTFRPPQRVEIDGAVEEEAVIVAVRRYTLLPLDDCLNALQPTIPHFARSSLHRCLQRHGNGRLPDVEGDRPAKIEEDRKRSTESFSRRTFKSYPISYVHIDIAEVRTEQGKLHMFVAIDEIRFTTPGAGGNRFTATTLT
ncbi:hypothetical protein HFN80_33085 [Rhizobium laguerreae]|nr:hypothetical protein [Rhizobium laguerreae]